MHLFKLVSMFHTFKNWLTPRYFNLRLYGGIIWELEIIYVLSNAFEQPSYKECLSLSYAKRSIVKKEIKSTRKYQHKPLNRLEFNYQVYTEPQILSPVLIIIIIILCFTVSFNTFRNEHSRQTKPKPVSGALLHLQSICKLKDVHICIRGNVYRVFTHFKKIIVYYPFLRIFSCNAFDNV